MEIYGLYEPSGELRYIGLTKRTAEERFPEHFWASNLEKPSHKANWLKSLMAKGQMPYPQTLQKLATVEEILKAEPYWIAFFKAEGCRLVNGTAGGEGLIDPTPEVRLRMSLAKKGKPSHRKGGHHSESTKDLLRQINLGKKASQETRDLQSRIHKGRTFSPKALALLRKAHLGRKVSEEGRARMSLAAKAREEKKRLNRQQSLVGG